MRADATEPQAFAAPLEPPLVYEASAAMDEPVVFAAPPVDDFSAGVSAVLGKPPVAVEPEQPVTPIAWHAESAPTEHTRTALQPTAHESAPGNGVGRRASAGAGWQIGGMFPATAMADDGALALRRADSRWALSDLDAPGDVIVEAVVDFCSGIGFGILFRAGLDPGGQLYGYSFDVDTVAGGGGYLVRQWEGNRPHWRPLAQAPVLDATHLLGHRTIELTVRGDSLAVQVDGEQVLSVASLSRASVELGREPSRGDRLGIQAGSTTEVTVDRLTATQQ
jgi:hypothetical protein